MSKDGEKFIPVFFVDEVKLGETFQSGEWPLHITLFPPVEMNYEESFGEAVRQSVNPIEPFFVTTGEPVLYGPNEDMPGHSIEPSPSLERVHEGLVRALATLRHDPTYRMPYNPHITLNHEDTRLEEGDTLWLEGLSIAVRPSVSQPWYVADKMRFKGTN